MKYGKISSLIKNLKIDKLFSFSLIEKKTYTNNICSKGIQYQYMNTSVLIFDKCTLKTILLNENHFQVRAYYNRLV